MASGIKNKTKFNKQTEKNDKWSIKKHRTDISTGKINKNISITFTWYNS